MKYRSVWIGIIAGVLYGLTIRLLIDIDEEDFLNTMSIAYIFGMPVIIGGLTVFFGSGSQINSWVFRILMPWLTIGAFLVTTLILYLEALLCVALLLPAFLTAASIGGILTGIIIDRSSRSTKTLSVVLIFPVLVGSIENQFNDTEINQKVVTEIMIQADQQTVWENIKNVDIIDPGELKWSYAHFIGIPRPISSEVNQEYVGGVRKIVWDKGIRFNEIITDWKILDHFYYKIEVDTIPPNAIDPHIKIGGPYFSVRSGGYELEKVDEQTTRLKLFCDYNIATKFNFYSNFWADFILDDFQVVILNVIKNRSERAFHSIN